MANTVLVTGAAGAIGQAIGRLFEKNGWAVVGVDIKTPSQPGQMDFFQADISQLDGVKAVAEHLQKKKQGLHCLINNAAVQVEKALVDTTEEEWDQVLRTNLTGVYRLVRALHGFFKGGSIVNIGSVHARATSPGMAAYVASKGGLSSLTRALALELAGRSIRVNALLPGAIDTPMLRQGLGRGGDAEKALDYLKTRTPLQKIGSPEEVAQLAFFLADEALSGNITGQEFVCDGGVTARLASE